jgi:hypothetical protein
MKPSLWVDLELAANLGVLTWLKQMRKVVAPISAADSVPDAYMGAGAHPDAVECVWDQLGAALPQDCRCLLYGTPALVQPKTGLVMAIAFGTAYYLRIPPDARLAAQAAGAKTLVTWTGGGRLDVTREFGPDWIIGGWLAQEPGWCSQVYQASQ